MSEINHIRTTAGLLSASVKTTYHVDWLTYAHTRNAGMLGLEDIVANAYGHEMEMLESPNDTDYSITVKKENLSDYEKKDLADHLKAKCFPCYSLNLILTDLANKNVIPEGHYVITMSW